MNQAPAETRRLSASLRCTARTLMARAQVSREIAEHCLGHKLAGVEGVYNRHDYLEEKRDAFEELAALVKTILNPPGLDGQSGT
jgi:hypothetical protein